VKILIVEDDADVRLIMSRALSRDGHTVSQAFNAPAAIRVLEKESFDLVLLDIVLDPEDRAAPTGWAVAAFMQADRRLRTVPVIVISALEPDDIREGATTYANVLVNAVMLLGKPLDLTVLLSAIDRIAKVSS
jgi:CheY-like chemotaxis protein